MKHFIIRSPASDINHEIHIVDFIQADAKSASGKAQRLKIETRWINRLRIAFPDGLNYLE